MLAGLGPNPQAGSRDLRLAASSRRLSASDSGGPWSLDPRCGCGLKLELTLEIGKVTGNMVAAAMPLKPTGASTNKRKTTEVKGKGHSQFKATGRPLILPRSILQSTLQNGSGGVMQVRCLLP